MDSSTGRFISQDTYQGTINDPVSLHKYLYANANPVMYSDPSGYASIMGKVVELAAKAELAIAEMMYNQTALVYWSMFTGAVIAAGDVFSKGDFTPEELIDAMFLGAIGGFVAVFVGIYFHGMILATLAGLGVIGGFAGAVDSFKNGYLWQGVYRSSWSVLGAVAWYRSFANIVKDWFESFGKNSRTGRAVIERMMQEGRVKETEDGLIFQDSEGHWHPIEEADMAHITDAVSWWNQIGRYYGPKSPEVRAFMLDPNNYYLEYYSINRSQGARIGETYLPPANKE